MAETYFMLRFSMASLAFALPLVLVYGNHLPLLHLPTVLPQHSLSAYYHAMGINGSANPIWIGVYRNLFVGMLSAIGICLLAYKGYNDLEDRLLNFAALALWTVAYFPMGVPASCKPEVVGACKEYTAAMLIKMPNGAGLSVHLAGAIVFFILLIATVWTTSKTTIQATRKANDSRDIIDVDAEVRRKLKRWEDFYNLLRFAMLAPVAVFILGNTILKTSWPSYMLYAEWSGIYVFATYWVIRTWEIRSIKYHSLGNL